jgi:NitT/TauT family transport system substrate-binding protein
MDNNQNDREENMGAIERLLAGTALLLLGLSSASAETLKLAIGQRGNWENAAPELGQKQGIFKKHGLELEILYTQGAGETLQVVIGGGADIGVGVGIYGAMAAFAKGAPVRAIANSTTGAHDLYWYVPAASPIKSLKDADGKTIAYSTSGSSTNLTALALLKEAGVNGKPTATGSPASTFTQTMSGQIDIGWASPPFGVEALEKGEIRIVARGSDVPSLRNQTVRVMITNLATLEARKDQIAKYLAAYRETLEWMYTAPEAIKAYAEWVKVSEKVAQHARDEFYPRENLRLDRREGVDLAMADAVAFKFLPAVLTKEQQDTFFAPYAKP